MAQIFERYHERVLVTDPIEANVPGWWASYGLRWIGTSNYEAYGDAVPRYFGLLQEGRYEEAMEIYWRIGPIREADFEIITEAMRGSGLIPRLVWKYQGWLHGFNGGPIRPPHHRIYDRQMAALRRAVELAGLDAAPPRGWDVAAVGVGAVAAAVETARLVAERAPARVLFVGTCGAYDGRLAPGDLLCASAAVATSLDELEGRAYRPEVERVRWDATHALPLPAHVVAVPPAITRTEAGARVLSQVAAAEHLELTGVFAACAAAGVPVAAALAVANRAGPRAHEEWRANHARASAALVAALRAHGVL
jgi:purine-nucleoside phosphorylase